MRDSWERAGKGIGPYSADDDYLSRLDPDRALALQQLLDERDARIRNFMFALPRAFAAAVRNLVGGKPAAPERIENPYGPSPSNDP